MTRPKRRWIAGCAALLLGAAPPAYSAPPQSGGDDRIDADQIFQNAKERANDLDEGDTAKASPDGDQSRTFTDEPGEDRSGGLTDLQRAERQNRRAPVLRPRDRNNAGGNGNGGNAGDDSGTAGSDAQTNGAAGLSGAAGLEEAAERLDRQASLKAAKGEAKRGKLPEGFDRLGLTEREEAAMLRVIAQYDRQEEELLDRFQKLHAEAIGIEAIALAGSVRQNGGSTLAAGEQEQVHGQAGHRQQGDQTGQRTAGFRPSDAAKPHGNGSQDRQAANGDRPAEEIKEIGQSSPFAGPSADIWRRLHEVHLDAVKVEAQKLAAIEKLLPPEKLQQLHQFRAESASRRGADQPAAGTSSQDRPDRPDLQNADENPEEQRRDAQSSGANSDVNKDHIDPNRSKKPLTERREDEQD